MKLLVLCILPFVALASHLPLHKQPRRFLQIPRTPTRTVTQTGNSGTFNSNNYPRRYSNNRKDRFVVQSSGSAVKLHFDSPFQVEQASDGYCYDKVRVLNIDQLNAATCSSSNDASSVIGEFCGTTAPADLDVQGSSVIVEFCSDYSVRKKGFKIEWSAAVGPDQPTTQRPPHTNPPQQGTTEAHVTHPPPTGDSSCGVQDPSFPPTNLGNRIVGGTHANPHSWPWQAAFMRDYGSPYGFLVYCGGSLVNNRWIVTAGHCFHDVSSSEYGDFYIKLGADDRGTTGSANENSQQVVGISKAIVHPQYDPNAISHDVTVVKLDRDVTLNEYVKPVCLASDTDSLAAGTDVVVTGWGSTSSGGSESQTLLQVVVPIVSNTECNSDYGGAVDDTMICAGEEPQGGKDSCQGDSGGPLVHQNSQGQWTLEGIVSWGYGCAEPNYPGVYSSVPALVDWIQETIAAN